MQNFERDVKQDMNETRFLVTKGFGLLIDDIGQLKMVVDNEDFIEMHVSLGLGGDDVYVSLSEIVDIDGLQVKLDDDYRLDRTGTWEDLYDRLQRK